MKAQSHIPYRPTNKNAWDFWFAHDGGRTHAFYLEYPDAVVLPDQSGRHGKQWIGHAVSSDLWNWRECGPVLRPDEGKWQSRGLATGCVVRDDALWYMLHTCRGKGKGGLALAVSEDLDHWEKCGDGPIIFEGQVFDFPWEGGSIQLTPLADPYIYPQKQGGFWVMICNSHVVEGKEDQRGATGMWRSRDLCRWEPHRVIAWDKCHERMETSQIWSHGQRWYLYFGGVHSENGHLNFVYEADSMDGMYTRRPWSRLELPGGEYFYIGKVIQQAAGDVFLAGLHYSSLSAPFALRYAEDGAVSLGEAELPPQ